MDNVPVQSDAASDVLELDRTAEGETWRGFPVIAYHWREASNMPPPSSSIISRAVFHWSTGPKTAEPLIRVKDAIAATLQPDPQVTALVEALKATTHKLDAMIPLIYHETKRNEMQAVADNARRALAEASQ